MIKIKENIDLSAHTTMKTGGKALYFSEAKTISDLKYLTNYALEKSLPLLVLGGGSNVLLKDGVIQAVVVKLTNTAFEKQKVNAKYTLVKMGGGLNWDKAVEKTVSANLSGIECLSAIPGTVGASPVQNIGAYGQELSDTFFSLRAYEISTQKSVIFTKRKCKFGYRDSIFKDPHFKGKYIIYEVVLKLRNNAVPTLTYNALTDYLTENSIEPTLVNVRNAVTAIRNIKLENPQLMPNTGSFFKNPVVSKKISDSIIRSYPDMPFYELGNKIKIPAAWLIEKSGWKGRRDGKVGVSAKHALVIINPEGKGTAKDIISLRDKIIQDVYNNFGIKLEPEVQFLT